MKDADKSRAELLAKAIAVLCVRNTFLEDLHSGITVSSRSGDYSDVKPARRSVSTAPENGRLRVPHAGWKAACPAASRAIGTRKGEALT
jgi:hypothetical protein